MAEELVIDPMSDPELANMLGTILIAFPNFVVPKFMLVGKSSGQVSMLCTCNETVMEAVTNGKDVLSAILGHVASHFGLGPEIIAQFLGENGSDR